MKAQVEGGLVVGVVGLILVLQSAYSWALGTSKFSLFSGLGDSVRQMIKRDCKFF